MNPVVTSGASRVSEPRDRVAPAGRSGAAERDPGTGEKRPRSTGSRSGVRVRKLERGADDGYSSGLVQGLKSSEDAERLAEEIAFAATRLVVIATDTPPVLTPMVSPEADLEERTWAAVQWEQDPAAAPVPWGSGEALSAYRAWAERAGSQQIAFTGESSWTPERRFERIFERLGTLGVLDREPRFDLLVILGRLGLYQLEAGRLFLSGENETTWAAKRALGIGDPLLLERRGADLAAACHVPLAALDLAFHNWGVGSSGRTGRGVPEELEINPDLLAATHGALGI
jgi:hypothetical protein